MALQLPNTALNSPLDTYLQPSIRSPAHMIPNSFLMPFKESMHNIKSSISFDYKREPLIRPDRGKAYHTFRLLKLLPGSELESVRCEIHTYFVNNAPPYEALSYCWGNPAQRFRIDCAQFTLAVTENAFLALTYLRLPDAPRLLWIDQLCIDQQNHQERSYQVSIMKLIYRKAARTLV